MRPFFLYCRKSSEAEDRQILSIESQEIELRRYATKHNLRIVEILTEAKSAKAPGRPVFNSLMQRLYQGEADGVLCWKLDRLARNAVRDHSPAAVGGSRATRAETSWLRSPSCP